MTLFNDERLMNPELLARALTDAGWRLMGKSKSGNARYEDIQFGARRWILVPEDLRVPGAAELLSDAWRQLVELSPGLLERILDQDFSGLHDSVRFRKETAAPRGLILWHEGEQLVRAARETLAAGAKAFSGKRAYFGNSNSGIIQRYLSATYMGQTGIGSYVVTALTPVLSLGEGLSKGSAASPVQGRDVTLSVATALGAAVEAIDHYQSTKSVAGFREAVSRGLSVELARGLVALAENAEEASISVDLDRQCIPLVGNDEPVAFEFTAADVPALKQAELTLAQDPEPALRQQVRGRVHVLTKAEVDGPGVIGIDTGAGKYRVRLNPDDYARAVRAHEVEATVVAEGLPSKEGHLVWLYQGRVIAVENASETLF